MTVMSGLVRNDTPTGGSFLKHVIFYKSIVIGTGEGAYGQSSKGNHVLTEVVTVYRRPPCILMRMNSW